MSDDAREPPESPPSEGGERTAPGARLAELHLRLSASERRTVDLAELWAPIPGACRYLAASGYCTGFALREVLGRLRAHRATVPEFSALFLLARAEIDDDAWEVIAGLLRDDPLFALFVLVGDRPAFHPKIVASAAREPARARVVVGSANLTAGGLHRNREAAVSVHDDPTLWDELLASVRALVDEPGVVKITSHQALAEQRELARLERSATWSPRAPFRALLEQAPDDDGAFRRALGALLRLVEGGVILLPPVELDSLSLSVPLGPYREQRVLAELDREFIAPGVTWGGRRASLSVSLLPEGVREACNRLSRQRSSLKGLFTTDALGRAWMPAAWLPAFRERWRQIPFDLPALVAEAEQHQAELGHELATEDVIARLSETLAVRPASAWRWEDDQGRPAEGLRDLPGLLGVPSLDHPVIQRSRETDEASPELRELVARGLRDHLQRTLRARIQSGYVRQRMAALGLEPSVRPCLIADPVELVLIVNGWVMRAAMAELRVEGGASPRSMVGREILEHLRGKGVNFEEVFEWSLDRQQEMTKSTTGTADDSDHAELKYIHSVAVPLARWIAGMSWSTSPLEEDA